MNPFEDDEEMKQEEEEWVLRQHSSFDSCDDALDESNHAVVASLPPQLHPAVSLGMKRVSSCYFSINSEASNSVADLLSLLEEENNQEQEKTAARTKWDASDVLYHDIMMYVFAFLNAHDLAAFSETARRPNFECFYFLQLQIERAILPATNHSTTDSLDEIEGVSSLSRLAAMDKGAATQLVQEYNDSNSTLRQMPLSHSLAYIRHVLAHGKQDSPPHALASAAFLVTLVGAASYMGGSTDAVLKVGLAGSLMGVGARKLSDDNNNNEHHRSMRDTAEQMARMMHSLPSQLLQQLHVMQNDEEEESPCAKSFPTSIAARMYAAFSSAYGPHDGASRNDNGPNKSSAPQPRRNKRSHKTSAGRVALTSVKECPTEVAFLPMTPDPYEHLPPEDTVNNNETTESDDSSSDGTTEPARKMPSGCVGAFSRVVQRAASRVTSLIKERRKAKFDTLSTDEQLQVSTSFLDACTSDDSLDRVKELICTIDADAFYVGSDGTETCALHTAAFHGACRVLEFLCLGLDENEDGGFCNVNLKDANLWTGLHFAAGANCVEAVQILSRHGADLTVEASNGYTPLHWAHRLSNDEVAEELERLGAVEMGWMRSQPLSVIASRFFALIPTH